VATREQKNVPSALPKDIEKLLERQLKQEKSRAEYNKRPDVKAKRKVYQQKQQSMRAVARAALKGNKEKLLELGYSVADAEKLIQIAKKSA